MLGINSSNLTFEKKIHHFKGTNSLKDKILKMREPILVYMDPDVDGVMSGFLVCRYLNYLGKRYKWYINGYREHGWFLDKNKYRGMDVIAVDFVIPIDKIKEIVNNDCNIISLDHHINGDSFIEYYNNNKYGFVINNQYPFEEESSRYLSGAGVVFESIASVDNIFDTLDHRSVVGITLLSDVRDIENPHARYYLRDLYEHKYNGYIKYLLEHIIVGKDYKFGVPRLDRSTVDYQLSPALNACFRFNQSDHVVDFVLGSGVLDLEYHTKQKELVSLILESIKIKDYSNLRVCYFMEDNVPDIYRDVLSCFVGLVDSRALDGVRSSICYMIGIKDGKKYVKRASFRGNINGLPYLKGLSGVLNGVGHESAFGIKELYPRDKLFVKCNEICRDVEKLSNYKSSIYECNNLAMFTRNYGKSFGEFNQYCLTKNRKLIKYNGSNIKNRRSGSKFWEYSVDGVVVLSFEKDINFSNGVICPTMERGFVSYYLERRGTF